MPVCSGGSAQRSMEQHGDGMASEEEWGGGVWMLADKVSGHVGHVTEP